MNDVAAISVGNGLHTVAILTDGRTMAWGNSEFDQLGMPMSTPQRNTPSHIRNDICRE